jgi:transposase
MNIINQNCKKSERYLPHEINTRYYAILSYKNGNKASYICRKYHISKSSLSRWNRKFDGTKESLIDKSHKPLTPHPNAHNELEKKWINDYIRRNPHITVCELWYKLKINKGYTRHPASLYRFLRKIGYYNELNINHTSKHKNKHYDTPKDIGIKWQIDVKFVPNECKCDNLPDDKRFYQWTCIDEASRERFIYHYEEHTPSNTVDFVKRCFLFYEYKPEEIQTDNGTEFTWNKDKMKKLHPLDQLCISENIYHHKIRPRTPRHNGKVERSHRCDNERFYNNLKFYSLDDLRYQAKLYLKRSNNIPMSVLNYKTPNEYRKFLEQNKKLTQLLLN